MDVCIEAINSDPHQDKTIKMNYEDRTVETPKELSIAASLSFHPSGLHLAVAYSDKLRILNLQDGESMSNYKGYQFILETVRH